MPASASGDGSTHAGRANLFRASWVGGIVSAFAIAIYVLLRLRGLAEFSLWGGESFLVRGARMGWLSLLDYLVGDMVHPPLPYVLLKIWVAVGGESTVWLKLFPVLAAVGAIVPLILLFRELGMSRFETNLVLILAAVNGFLIHYAQEVRMYSLFLFFTLCSAWLFVRYCNEEGAARRELLYLTAVNVLLVYTHTYGWLVLGVEGLVLLAMHRERLAGFFKSILTVILLFLPWAFLVLRELMQQGSPFGFIPQTTLRHIVHLYAAFNGPLKLWDTIRPGLVLFALPVAWWFIRIALGRAERSEIRLFLWLTCFSFVPVFTVVLAGWMLDDSYWWDRYFIFVAPFYLALVAASVYRLRPEALRIAYACLLVVLAAAASYSDLSTDRVAWRGPQVGSRLDWEGVAHELVEATPSDVSSVDVYMIPVWSVDHMAGLWAIYMSIPFYMAPEHREKFEFHNAWNYDLLFVEPLGPEFWIATYELGGIRRPIPEADFRDMGYVVTSSFRFGEPGRAFLLAHVVRADTLAARSTSGDSIVRPISEP